LACEHSLRDAWTSHSTGFGLAGLLVTLLFAALTPRRDLPLFSASLLALVVYSVILMPEHFLSTAFGMLGTAALVVVELSLAAYLIRRVQRSTWIL